LSEAQIGEKSSCGRFNALKLPRAASQRDEFTSSHLIELHSVPANQSRIAAYRISEDQSGGNGDQSKARDHYVKDQLACQMFKAIFRRRRHQPRRPKLVKTTHRLGVTSRGSG